MRWGAQWADNGLAFTQEDGTPLHPQSLSTAFKRAVKTSGLPAIRFHDLRHTHATMLLSANVHPKVVADRLGHASITITLDTYSHVLPALGREAADTIGQLLADG